MAPRSNKDWLWALTQPAGEAYDEALHDLQDFLLRAALVYLFAQRSELSGWGREEVRTLAEDLVQEALLEIRESLDKFRGESKFTTWAYRFVINRAASELRRRRYQELSLDQLREEQPAVFEALLSVQEGAAPEQQAQRRAYLELIRQIINQELEPRQRAAIIGVYWQGYEMDAVAEALDLNRNALYKLLHDARKRIKARLSTRRLTASDILAAFQD
ncbi:MAG TPA: sigma-70 family RNA polymerase sigma factor [Anaerolineales bacterium]|nr:sigma-70 family RNA polymerase sigma factor [Anaerolineales bacterium]